MAADQLGRAQGPVADGSAAKPSLRDHYLRRLETLVQQRAEFLRQGGRDALQKKLLDRAIFATVMDCVQTGAGADAQAILDAQRAAS